VHSQGSEKWMVHAAGEGHIRGVSDEAVLSAVRPCANAPMTPRTAHPVHPGPRGRNEPQATSHRAAGSQNRTSRACDGAFMLDTLDQCRSVHPNNGPSSTIIENVNPWAGPVRTVSTSPLAPHHRRFNFLDERRARLFHDFERSDDTTGRPLHPD